MLMDDIRLSDHDKHPSTATFCSIARFMGNENLAKGTLLIHKGQPAIKLILE
jgi:hypothetical protein